MPHYAPAFLALTLTLGFTACAHQDDLAEPTTADSVAALEASELVCSAETQACGTSCVDANTDPNNCGTCGNVCASGLCFWGTCGDDRPGNVFAIGHSYEKSNPALDRVLGNAIGAHKNVAPTILLYRGTNSTALAYGTQDAIVRGLRNSGRLVSRPFFTASSSAVMQLLPSYDVLVIAAQPQMTDAQLGVAASDMAMAIDDHVRRGGVVIALDAPSSKNRGTVAVLGELLPVRRATTAPGGVGSISAFDNIATAGAPTHFALSTSVGYEPSGYTDAVTTESGHVLVAHRSFH